jgi:hypothetical protein
MLPEVEKKVLATHLKITRARTKAVKQAKPKILKSFGDKFIQSAQESGPAIKLILSIIADENSYGYLSKFRVKSGKKSVIKTLKNVVYKPKK